MIVIGCDLAGPSNPTDSTLMVFELQGSTLSLLQHLPHFTDNDFCHLLERLYRSVEPVIIGFDAPLSYNPGGGDRPADAELRRRLVEVGLKPGTVMPPTFNRMVYLTLRGVVLARMAIQLGSGVRIVEVHPAGAMALRGAMAEDVRGLKVSQNARNSLQIWLASQGLLGLANLGLLRDHDLAAAGAALAAWHWATGQSAWQYAAQPPHHPFDFVC